MTDPVPGEVFNVRPAPTHCGLCFQPLGASGGVIAGGLSLCDPCFHGDVAERLGFRGFRFEEQSKAATLNPGPTDFQFLDSAGPLVGGVGHRFRQAYYVALGAMARRLPLEVSFTRQADGGGLKSLLRREPKVGDKLFDRTVFVDARRSEALLRFLAAPGLQSVIMDMVAQGGEVTLKGNAARLHFESPIGEDPPPFTELRRNTALLLHYADIYCQHLERPTEVAWPPAPL